MVVDEESKKCVLDVWMKLKIYSKYSYLVKNRQIYEKYLFLELNLGTNEHKNRDNSWTTP